MQLNPKLARLLEAYEPDRLKAILLWFNADAQSLPAQNERLNAILDEMQTMTIDTCYRVISELEMTEMIRISILNEFGPQFEQRAAYQWLNRAMGQTLALRYQIAN